MTYKDYLLQIHVIDKFINQLREDIEAKKFPEQNQATFYDSKKIQTEYKNSKNGLINFKPKEFNFFVIGYRDLDVDKYEKIKIKSLNELEMF